MSPVPTSKHWRMEVEWVDSTLTHQEGWVTMAAVLSRRRRRDAVRCLSVGFVLADDDAGIVLAATVHGNEVAGITHVPAGAIVSRRRLRPDPVDAIVEARAALTDTGDVEPATSEEGEPE